MSNLGFHVVLRSLRSIPWVRCERAFWDPLWGGAGTSFDSGVPLSEFDVLAFSISFEADFLNIPRVLEASGIPLRSEERTQEHPLVVMGGFCAFLNPEPVAPFMDVVLVGEAEELVDSFAAHVAESTERGVDRMDVLAGLSRLDGVYVPRLYAPQRGEDLRITGFRAHSGAPLPVRAAVGRGGAKAESVVLSPCAHFASMFLIETTRGCGRGCRFCAAGYIYTLARHRRASELVAAARSVLPHTRRVGLVTAALCDHPELKPILLAMRELGVELSVSSIRAERLDAEEANLLAECGVRSVTIAPEAGAAKLRRMIGKPTSDEQILAAAKLLGRAGMDGLKLYFMIGLPGETDDDLEAIPSLVQRVRESFVGAGGGFRVSVSASTLVPKPRTPFQWIAMDSEAAIRGKIRRLGREIRGRLRLEFTSVGPREAVREGVLSRGGRELAGPIEQWALHRVPWKAALRRGGVDADWIVGREYGEGEIFPWDIVETGHPREALLCSYRAARALMADRRRADP